MVQISITIDDNNKAVINQSVSPTKVEKPSKPTIADKVYFIVMCNYKEQFWVELVTDNYHKAYCAKTQLEKVEKTLDYTYIILVQKNGSIMPCNGADFDIDSL